MIKRFCDSCGIEVDRNNGVIESKELTIELNDKKISIVIQLDTWNKQQIRKDPDDMPVLCHTCLLKRLAEWVSKGN